MKAVFLQAAVPLTKTFNLVDGEIQKIGHPRVMDYTSHEESFDTIEELLALLRTHAAKGHCFLKGMLSRALRNESRAGTTDANAITRILLLDLDGIKNLDDVEILLAQLKLGHCDYIIQYSSSMGVIPERGLSAHVFIFLDKDYPPAVLKQWLIQVNLSVDSLRSNLGLTRTNNALRWPLDVTTCQNDKLIYIAPPILGPGVKDGLKGERITLVKRKLRTASLPKDLPSAEANKIAVEKALNELRVAAGLPKRAAATYKAAGALEYLAKPDRAIVTGVKTDRGFTYLNINGGDSWGYYHPENNPEFILNFKSEPNYRTAELLPDYWADVRTRPPVQKADSDGTIYLAFRDFPTSTYYNGTYNEKTKELVLAQAKGAEQLRHFLKQHGQPVGEFVPDWRVMFDPHSDVTVNLEEKTVNTYKPPIYASMKLRKVKEVPPTIKKVMMHVVGDDEEVLEHLLNWLAVLVRYRSRTLTAWVFHGIEGTGKGLLVDLIIAPLMGRPYVIMKRMEELESGFNGYLEQCFVLAVDEAQLSEFKRANIINASIKNYIVSEQISVRRMYALPYMVTSYLNLLFLSNMPDPVIISETDRRFNVAAYQSAKIDISPAEYASLKAEEEMYDFYCYLMGREADQELARTPLNNEAKRQMAHIGRQAIDVACDALLTGDLQFFVDQKPGDPTQVRPGFAQATVDSYIALVERLEKEKPPVLLREELQALLTYAIGNIPESPHKFSSLLKHHKVHIGPISWGGKTARGIKVEWK